MRVYPPPCQSALIARDGANSKFQRAISRAAMDEECCDPLQPINNKIATEQLNKKCTYGNSSALWREKE